MDYKEYLDICKEEGYPPHNLLSMFELEWAKERAVQIAKKHQTMKRLEGKVSQNIIDGMDKWEKQQKEIQMKHMFDALDYSRIMKGLGEPFDRTLRKKWKLMGMDEPRI